MRRVLTAVGWIIVGAILLYAASQIQMKFHPLGGGGDDQPPIIVSDGSVDFMSGGKWKPTGGGYMSDGGEDKKAAQSFTAIVAGASSCSSPLTGDSLIIIGGDPINSDRDQYQVDHLGASGKVRVTATNASNSANPPNAQATISPDGHTLTFVPSSLPTNGSWVALSIASCEFDPTKQPYVLILPHQ